MLLLENTSGTEDAVKAADQVMATLTESFHVDGHDLPMTASIGIVERPTEGSDPTDLMRAADMTLHWAKTDGKARWTVFDADRNAREVDGYTLAAAMPAALDRGEFTLVYQPIVGLARGTPGRGRGAGPLGASRTRPTQTRPVHPPGRGQRADRRARPPTDGAGLPAGRRVARLGIRRARSSASTSPSARSAIRNWSPTSPPCWTAPGSRRTSCSWRSPRAPSWATTKPWSGWTRLAGLGVRLAIDDFGTGYSNLAYLRTLPVHALKLAGQFVDDLRRPPVLPSGNPMPGASPEAAFLRILVTLGHILGLTVIAEGVETLQQAEVLRAIGCESGQGYYLGLPTSPDEITELLHAA